MLSMQHPLTERQIDNKWLTQPAYCTVQCVAVVLMESVIGFTGNAFLQAVVCHLISLAFQHHMLLLCIYLCSHTAVRKVCRCRLCCRSDLLMFACVWLAICMKMQRENRKLATSFLHLHVEINKKL